MISDTYLGHMTSFADLRVVIVGDLDVARASAQTDKHGVGLGGTTEQVLAHPEVELLVNLTIPAGHAAVLTAALSAWKHIWPEKPISADRAAARGRQGRVRWHRAAGDAT
jgi:predicted dehydrogenase